MYNFLIFGANFRVADLGFMQQRTPIMSTQKLIILILSLFAGSCLHAQGQPQTLEEVTVTATRIPMEAYKTGRSITIITAERLRAMPVSTVDEMLRYVAGVNLNMRGPFGVQTDIGIRGSTFSQVLVMVDNVRLNDPLTAHFNNNIPVAMSEIAQIEIVRGPAASSYGSDAVGGLIHIKTKTYLGLQGPEGLELAGELSAGQHQLQSADVGAVLRSGKWQFSSSLKSNISDGETLPNPNFAAGTATDSLYQNYFDIRTYSASVGYKANEDLRFYVRGSADYRDFAAKYFYTQSTFDESTEQIDQLWTQGAVQYTPGKHHLELTAGYKVTDDVFAFNPAFAPNEHRTWQTFLNLNDRLPVGERSEVAFGVQHLQQRIRSTDRGNHSHYSTGLYGVFSHDFSSNWHANASLRLENDANFGLELLPQASVSYKAGNYLLRAAYGRAVRAADFTERFVSSQIPNLAPGRNIGNPDLQAERSDSWEVGSSFYLPGQLTLSAATFYRRSTNLIDFSLRNADEISNVNTLQSGADYFYTDNIAEAATFGLELTLEKAWAFSESCNLKAQLNYTWLETTAPGDVVSKYIANHPSHNAAANVQLQLGWFSLSSSTNFIVRQSEVTEAISGQIPSQYWVSNLRANVRVAPSLTLFGQAFNIGNTQYQEVLGARLPGRWLCAGIRWQ